MKRMIIIGVLAATVAGLAVMTAATAAPRHNRVDLWAAHVDFGKRASIHGWSHYHRDGHRRTIELKLYHAAQLRDKVVRVFVKGKDIGTARARHKKFHLVVDTANGDLVPRVHCCDHVVVRQKHRTRRNCGPGDQHCHAFIASGSYICDHRHCRR